jgi:hypothetical protein
MNIEEKPKPEWEPFRVAYSRIFLCGWEPRDDMPVSVPLSELAAMLAAGTREQIGERIDCAGRLCPVVSERRS